MGKELLKKQINLESKTSALIILFVNNK